jgi:hypothetical protein
MAGLDESQIPFGDCVAFPFLCFLACVAVASEQQGIADSQGRQTCEAMDCRTKLMSYFYFFF